MLVFRFERWVSQWQRLQDFLRFARHSFAGEVHLGSWRQMDN